MFDWSELAFGSKSELRQLKPTLIAAPRDISLSRLKQLIQQFLPKGNLLIGVAKHNFVLGFEDQPQFTTWQPSAQSLKLIEQVNLASPKHKVKLLSYGATELPYIIDKVPFQKIVFINGSWQYAFHTTRVFYSIVSRNIPYDLVSPFASEKEAEDYESRLWPAIEAEVALPKLGTKHSAMEMLELAKRVSRQSYDYNYQTGVVIGRPAKQKDTYELLCHAFNKVVPYQTFAMHHGAARETHLSPPHDLNHYDTLHAETMMLVQAQRDGIDLRGTTLFINLLPCPTCCRILSQTDIAEVVYSEDHSAGYAVYMFEKSGKTVRRLVPKLL